MQRSILAGAHSSRKTHCPGVACRVEESRLHAVMNGMCACVHAYVCAYMQRGSEHGPDLQVEKSRAAHAGMKDTLCGE